MGTDGDGGGRKTRHSIAQAGTHAATDAAKAITGQARASLAYFHEVQQQERLFTEATKKVKTKMSISRMSGSFDSLEKSRNDDLEELWSAEDRLSQATRSSNMGHIIKYSQYISQKDIKKLGVEKQALIKVSLDDEWQKKCAVSYPIILVYLAMFIYTFQENYGISSMFLQENQMRLSLVGPSPGDGAPPIEIPDIGSTKAVFSWMDSTLVPYLWSCNNVNVNGMKNPPGVKQYSTAWATAHQELVAGFWIKTARGPIEKCKHKGLEMFQCLNEHESISVKASVFSGWRRAQRRLDELDDTGRRLRQLEAERERLGRGHLQRMLFGLGGSSKLTQQEAAQASVRARSRASKARRMASNGRARHSKMLDSKRLQKLQQVLLDEEIREERQQVALVEAGRRLGYADAAAHLRDSIPGSDWEHMYTYYVPMSMSLKDVKAQLTEWQKASDPLISNTTLMLTVGFMVRNPDINHGLLSTAEISFSFSRSGTIFQEMHFNSLVLRPIVSVIVFLVLWGLVLVAFTIQSSFKLHTAVTHGDVCTYFLHLSNFFEWLLVITGWTILIMVIIERVSMASFNSFWEEYQASRLTTPAITLKEFDRSWVERLEEHAKNMNGVDENCQILVAFYHIFLVFRILMASQGHPRLAIVINTIGAGANDLLHLFIVLGVIFMAFVLMGMLLFGTRMEMFSNTKAALGYCMQILLQRQYDNITLQKQDYWTSLIWILAFVLIVVLVVLNIVLAMIFDNYGDVVNTITKEDTIWHTAMRQWNHLRNYSVWVSNSRIIQALSRAGNELVTKQRLVQLIPQITNEQIDELFATVKLRLVTNVVRTKKNIVPEALAAILLGVDELRTGVRLMSQYGPIESEEVKRPPKSTQRGGRSTENDGEGSEPNTARGEPSTNGNGSGQDKEKEKEEEEDPDGDHHMLDQDRMVPPQKCPYWVQEGLLKHLRKRQAIMDQLYLQIQQIHGEVRKRGLGTHCDEIPVEEPEQPDREGSKRLDSTLTGQHMKPMVTPGMEREKSMAERPRPTMTPGDFGMARRMRRPNP